jgi:hypothetical protein
MGGGGGNGMQLRKRFVGGANPEDYLSRFAIKFRPFYLECVRESDQYWVWARSMRGLAWSVGCKLDPAEWTYDSITLDDI